MGQAKTKGVMDWEVALLTAMRRHARIRPIFLDDVRSRACNWDPRRIVVTQLGLSGLGRYGRQMAGMVVWHTVPREPYQTLKTPYLRASDRRI